MSNPFDIQIATNTIDLQNRRGVVTFTVTNTSSRHIRAIARIRSSAPGEWFTILTPEDRSEAAGDGVRTIGIGQTEHYEVAVRVPESASSGSHTLRLVVADEDSPDESFSESGEVSFIIPEPEREEPKPSSIPWIPIAAIIAVIAVVGVIILILLNRGGGEEDPTAEAPVAVAWPADSKVLYLHQPGSSARGEGYRKLIELDTPLEVDVEEVNQINVIDIGNYDLMIVGSDVTDAAAGLATKIETARRNGLSIIAIGKAGTLFLSVYSDFFEFSNASGCNTDGGIVQTPEYAIWEAPFPLESGSSSDLNSLQLYQNATSAFAVLLKSGAVPLLLCQEDMPHASLAFLRTDAIWGYEGEPDDMADAGRRLFINLIYHVITSS